MRYGPALHIRRFPHASFAAVPFCPGLPRTAERHSRLAGRLRQRQRTARCADGQPESGNPTGSQPRHGRAPGPCGRSGRLRCCGFSAPGPHHARRAARHAGALRRRHARRRQQGRLPDGLDQGRQDLAGDTGRPPEPALLPQRFAGQRPGRTRLLARPDGRPATSGGTAPRGQHRADGGAQPAGPRTRRHAAGPRRARKLFGKPDRRGPTGRRRAPDAQVAAGRCSSPAGRRHSRRADAVGSQLPHALCARPQQFVGGTHAHLGRRHGRDHAFALPRAQTARAAGVRSRRAAAQPGRAAQPAHRGARCAQPVPELHLHAGPAAAAGHEDAPRRPARGLFHRGLFRHGQ